MVSLGWDGGVDDERHEAFDGLEAYELKQMQKQIDCLST